MVCKKCGKEFTNETSVCPFCNEDNKVVVEQTQEVTEEKVEPVVEELIVDEPKKEPEVEELVVDEPVVEDLVIEETPKTEVSVNEISSEEPVETTVEDSTNIDENQETISLNGSDTLVIGNSVESTTEDVVTSKKNNSKMIFYGIIILILAVVTVVMYLPKDEEEANDNNPATNSTPPTNNIDTDADINDLFSYSGTYVNDDVEISLYTQKQFNNKYVTFTVTTPEEIYSDVLVMDKDKNLVYNGTSLDEDINIRVEKTANGIKVTSSSTDTESILNNISNNYIKEDKPNYDWSGVYQLDNGYAEMTIDYYREGMISIYCTTIEYVFYNYEVEANITDTTITYEDQSTDKNIKIVIEKNGDSINVTWTSTNPGDNVEPLNGKYVKVN